MWFYVHNKKAEGPVSEEILHSLLTTGTLAPEVLVWREGQSAWAPARSVFDFVDLADGKGFALMGAAVTARPPPIPGVEPAAGGGTSGAEVSVEPVSVLEPRGAVPDTADTFHTPNSLPEHSPQTRGRKGGFLWFFLPLLCLMALFFLLFKYQERPVPNPTLASPPALVPPPTLVPPRTVPSAQPAPTASPWRPVTQTPPTPTPPTPAPSAYSSGGAPLAPGQTYYGSSSSRLQQGNPGDFFFMVERNGAIYVVGRKESLVALMRDNSLPNTHIFPGRGVGGKDLYFEGDANVLVSQQLRQRLISTYDTRFGTSVASLPPPPIAVSPANSAQVAPPPQPNSTSPTNPAKVAGGKVIEVKNDGSVVIDRGTTHGLRQGALLRLYDGKFYRGRVQVTHAGALESVARSLERSPGKFEVGYHCVFRTHDHEPWKPTADRNPGNFFQTIKTNGAVYVLGTQAGVDQIRGGGRLPVTHMVRFEGPRGLDLHFEADPEPGEKECKLSDRLRSAYDARFATSTRRGGFRILDGKPKSRGGVIIVDGSVGSSGPDEVFLIMQKRDRFAVAGTPAGVLSRGEFHHSTSMRYIEPSLQTRFVDFEIDPNDPTLLARLVQRYNLVQGTHLRPEYFEGMGTRGQGTPKASTDWRTTLKRFPDLAFGSEQVFVRLETSEGEILMKMMPATAPNHVSNFVWLSAIGYYDGLTLHRAIPGFMVQGGCPFGRGSGGPGYQFAGEFDPSVIHDRPGLLSMANRGPGTDGSQFFLTFAAAEQLNGKHTIFGEIDQGMSVLRSIEKLGSPSGATSKPITIIKATVEWGR